MAKKPLMNMVCTQCDRVEDEERFDQWYNEVHVPMLFKFKGMKEVTRYRPSKKTGEPTVFVTLYTFEDEAAFEAYGKSPEYIAAIEEMKQSWKDGGFRITNRVQYEPIQSWKR